MLMLKLLWESWRFWISNMRIPQCLMLNCFHSLCKAPFVNLHQFSQVIYKHQLHPLPVAPAFVCLHGFYMFHTGLLFHLHACFLHVSYGPLFFIDMVFTWFLQGFKHSISRLFVAFGRIINMFFTWFGKAIYMFFTMEDTVKVLKIFYSILHFLHWNNHWCDVYMK